MKYYVTKREINKGSYIETLIRITSKPNKKDTILHGPDYRHVCIEWVLDNEANHDLYYLENNLYTIELLEQLYNDDNE
jgi:hypothetical protein